MLSLFKILFPCFFCLFLCHGHADDTGTTPNIEFASPDSSESGDSPNRSTENLSRDPQIKWMIQNLSPSNPQCSPRQQQLLTPKESPKSAFKDRQELETYIKCFFSPASADRYTKAIYNNVSAQDQIEQAGNAFNLPPAFLACSYLKESGLNPTIRSNKSCIGIAQINLNTVSTIDEIIGAGLDDKKVKNRTYYEAILSNELPQETSQNAREIIKLKAQRAEAKLRLVRDDLAKAWKKYFQDRNLPVPKRFNQSMLTNPTFAIPAGALYFKFLAFNLMKSLPNEAIETTEKPSTMQILAASSNWGPGRIRTLARNEKSHSGPVNSEEELFSLLQEKAPWETKYHMSTINTCMEAGNSKRMLKLPAGKKPKQCEGTE